MWRCRLNEDRISRKVSAILKIFKEESVTNEEYLIILGNLLISFGSSGLEVHSRHKDVDLRDCAQVEIALGQNPNDPYLASVLQGNILIKWSEHYIE